MGKKVKVGKQRRDKAYWSAKEIGFRSRASFKLIQLNRKFEFLQKSRVCIDLCAAPGSWMQVAKEHMPVSSLIIGVDLVPIKPIPGCISLVNDITTEKCLTDLKRELQGWKPDLVLHDGAPNVGRSWIHDAYQQALITLSAFKIVSRLLRDGGTFVTKIFRSKDYQSLLWVFRQFFKRVHSTKPPASRAESAEIFVVCLGYKAPDKIDPRFLDPTFVFSEISQDGNSGNGGDENNFLENPEKRKKPAAEGYDSDAVLLYKSVQASEFIMEDKPIHVLNNCHEIIVDQDRIKNHPKTTLEIIECLKDIKVLGMKELRMIKKWRSVLRTEFLKDKDNTADNEAGDGNVDTVEKDNDDEDEEEELRKLDSEIDSLNDEERRAAKRKRKQTLKDIKRRNAKINLKMVIPGDVGPTQQEEGLFNITSLKTAKDLEAVVQEGDENGGMYDDSSDSDSSESTKNRKFVKYDKEKGKLHKAGLFYKKEEEDDDDDDDEEGSIEEDSENEDLGLEYDDEMIGNQLNEEEVNKFNDRPANPLILDLDHSDRNARRERKSELWFDKDVFKGINDDDNEELEDVDIENAIKNIKQRGGSIKQKEKPQSKPSLDSDGNTDHDSDSDSASNSDSDSDSDSDYDIEASYRNNKTKGKSDPADGEFEIVPQQKAKKRTVLTPEELALGQQMIRSKKAKRDITDSGWNRYMFQDQDEDLPDWFVNEERYHMRKPPKVDPAAVQYYREKQKDLNVKTIKKVVEAKARKRRRISKKMEKAKKRAASILENTDIGNREKAKEISRMYKKINAKENDKKQVTYTVAKKFSAAKKAKRPSGVKGLYKQVDPRMKKDNVKKRSNASGKRIQKRRLKGKKARPNAK